MKHYRVKPEFDNGPRYRLTPRGVCVRDSVLVGNELYTAVERSKIANRRQMFDIVNVPKNKTFFSFGARFEMKVRPGHE
jgi:hypothetical protein